MTPSLSTIVMALLTFVCLSATVVVAFTADNYCDPGFYFDSEARVCSQCPLDTYKPDVKGPCKPCPRDKFGEGAVTRSQGAYNVSQCIFRPYIGTFSPTYGPISGGTEVKIRVHHLQDRRIIVLRFIHIDAVEEYHFSQVDENRTTLLTCWTSPTGLGKSGPLHMQLADNRNEYSFDSDEYFHYRPDPIVFTIYDIRTIVSGGILIDVNGTFFTSVAHPFLVVTRIYYGVHRRFVTPCQVKSSKLMTCLTPNLTDGLNVSAVSAMRFEEDDADNTTDQDSRFRRDLSAKTNGTAKPINNEHLHFFAGFKLDGVKGYDNFTELPVYWDPDFYRFHESQHLRLFNPSEHPFIDIKGARINHGISIDDITVTIGEEPCNITFLATNYLTCRPPDHEPPPGPNGEGPEHSPMVVVKVGAHLSFVIGYLRYVNDTTEPVMPSTSEKPTNTHIMTIVIVTVCLFWVLLIATCCMFFLFRRQKRRRKYKYKYRTPTPETMTSNYVGTGSEGSSNNGFLPNSTDGRLDNGYLTPILDQETMLSVLPNGQHYQNGIITNSSQSNGIHGSNNAVISQTATTVSNGNVSRNGYLGMAVLNNGGPAEGDHCSRQQTDNLLTNSVLVGLDECNREKVKACCLDSRRLTTGSLLGSGNYGKVYKGVLADENFQNSRAVAVKTLKESVQSPELVKEFLEEALVMKGFSHPHVLTLYGVVIRELKPQVVLEYMNKGDLKTHVSVKAMTMTVGELLDLAYQVSEGMVYLAEHGFVHRDVAARNCMINCELTVKIADFGLSRDMHEKEYYTASDKERPMPVKWMSVESLNNGRYSTKSDVWSFGVLLWEVLMRGVTPYPDVDNFDIRNYLNEGHRLSKPSKAPDDVYDLMLSCWKADPCDRPDFRDISRTLSTVLADHRELNTLQYLTILADTEPCCETSWAELEGGPGPELNNNETNPVNEQPSVKSPEHGAATKETVQRDGEVSLET